MKRCRKGNGLALLAISIGCFCLLLIFASPFFLLFVAALMLIVLGIVCCFRC